jgi:alkyl hydroperoxide reductase subunit AhpF
MPLLGEEDVAFLREQFGELAHDVSLAVITKPTSRLVVPGHEEEDADASEEVRQIAAEVAATSPRIQLESVDAASDRARALAGERAPALVLSSPSSRGRLRYYGLPAGYEMSTLVAAISDLGVDEPILPDEVQTRLGGLAKDVHIQVFVTPG